MNKIIFLLIITNLISCKEIIHDTQLASEIVQDVELAEVKIEKDIEQFRSEDVEKTQEKSDKSLHQNEEPLCEETHQ